MTKSAVDDKVLQEPNVSLVFQRLPFTNTTFSLLR